LRSQVVESKGRGTLKLGLPFYQHRGLCIFSLLLLNYLHLCPTPRSSFQNYIFSVTFTAPFNAHSYSHTCMCGNWVMYPENSLYQRCIYFLEKKNWWRKIVYKEMAVFGYSTVYLRMRRKVFWFIDLTIFQNYNSIAEWKII